MDIQSLSERFWEYITCVAFQGPHGWRLSNAEQGRLTSLQAGIRQVKTAALLSAPQYGSAWPLRVDGWQGPPPAPATEQRWHIEMEINDFHNNLGEFGTNENRYKLFKSAQIYLSKQASLFKIWAASSSKRALTSWNRSVEWGEWLQSV